MIKVPSILCRWGYKAFAISLAIVFQLSAKIEAQPPTTLRIGTLSATDIKHMRQVVAYIEKLSDLLPRNTYSFDLSFLPTKRLLQEAADGRLDGLAFRVAQTQKIPGLQKLIRVPSALTYIHLAVYTLDSTLPCFDSWQDIASRDDRFGVNHGHVLADHVIDSLNLSARRIYVDSSSQAIALMQKGRIRYFIQTYEVFEPFLRSTQPMAKVYFNGEIATEGVYLFLAPKFEKAVPVLNDAITKMTNSEGGILDAFSQAPVRNPKNCRIDLW